MPHVRGNFRAEDRARTGHPNLGKVMLYQMSYFRFYKNFCEECKNRNLHFTTKFLSLNFTYTVVCTKCYPALPHQDGLYNDAGKADTKLRPKKQSSRKPARKRGNAMLLPNCTRILCLYNLQFRFPYSKICSAKIRLLKIFTSSFLQFQKNVFSFL